MDEPTLAERLGGRWAISRPGYMIALAGAGMLVANIVHRHNGGPDSLAIGTVLTIIIALTAPVDLVLHRTAFSRRAGQPVAVQWVIAKHAYGGLVLVASAWWVTQVMFEGLQPLQPSAWVTIPVVAIWGGSAITVTLDLWWRSAQVRLAIADEAARLDLALLHERALTDEIIRSQVSSVGAELLRLQRDLDDLAQRVATDPEAPTHDPTAVRHFAQDLRTVSQGPVRSASSALWRRAERLMPRTTWWMQVANIVRTQPLRPLVIITLGPMPTILWEATDLGGWRSAGLSVSAILALLAVCSLANAAMARWPHWHLRIYLATVVVLQIGQLVAIRVKNSWVPGYVTDVEALVQVVTGVLLILFSSGWATFWNLSHRRHEVFDTHIAPARAQVAAKGLALSHATRALAEDLHSGTQARLFASAMALEDAADSGDLTALNHALAATREALAAPLSAPPGHLDLASSIEAAIAAWDGLCEITLHRPEHLEELADPVVVRRLIDEGLMNAIRHGGAHRIQVRVDHTATDRVRIEIRDDGVPIAPQAPRGLGSVIFDQIAPGRWGRVTDPSGTRGTLLWVELASPEPHASGPT